MNETNLPKIVLGIVKNKNNKILIIQRAKVEKGTNEVKLSWAFPGGKIEDGETKEKAVEREILEETGYIVKAGKIINEKQHPQFPIYVYYFKCMLINNSAVSTPDPDEIKQVLFIDHEGLSKYFTTNVDEKVLEYLNNG